MAGLIAVRDSIRDFLRKYDEVITPVIRFIFALVIFSCVNSLFGYSEFLDRGVIVFLLSVISALVSTPIVVFLAGVVIAVHCFSVSIDVGVLALLLFLIMYCSYMRMFQNTGYVLALVPVLYMLKLPFAAPVLVAIFAGFSGAVPAAFGVVLYYFAQYVKEAQATLTAGTEKDFQGYAYIVNNIVKDKNMLLAIIAFAIVILVTAFIYRLRFDYAWYVAIGVGSVFTILVFMVCGMFVGVNANAGSLVLGSLLGGVVSVIVQMCKSVVDYSRKEVVQFEDDDYYYYVKAIPKLGSQKKTVKNITEDVETQMDNRKMASRQGVDGQARPARPQHGADGQARPARPQHGADGQARPGRQTQAANGQARPGRQTQTANGQAGQQARPRQGANSQARQPRQQQENGQGRPRP